MNDTLQIIRQSKIESELYDLAVRTAYVCGEPFFHELVKSLSRIFKVSTVFVAKCVDQPVTQVQTIALLHHDRLLENICYSIDETPCQTVFDKGVGYFPKCVQSLFPRDKDLQTLAVESYGGLEVEDASGVTIGHIGIMDVNELLPEVWSLPALRLIRARCGAEIERLKFDEERQAIRRSYDSILDSAVDGMFLKNVNQHFEYLNRACEKMLGIQSRSLIGSGNDRIAAREFRHCIERLDVEVLKQKVAVSAELEIQEPNGFSSSFQITESPVLSNNKVTGIVGVVRDVTELNETREILDENLRLASLGTIAAGIAHEINNPLAAIQLLAESAMKDGSISSGTDEYLATILESVQAASQIVDEVLKTSTDQKNSKKVHLLGDILNKALDQTRSTSQQAGISIELGELEEVYVEVNSIEIRQVLINLITNAIQASSESERKKIEINISRADKHCSCSVRDYGKGISDSDQSQIFEPFFTTRLGSGGTGLGLSISKRIAQNHQGRIFVEPVKSGALFVFELPLQESPTDANRHT